MSVVLQDGRRLFDRGIVILSFDVEQIWGYLDLLNEAEFERLHPDAIDAHTRLLTALAAANVRATWFVVGGLALRGSQGDRDPRIAGLPYKWTSRIQTGNESTAPLWYRHSFIQTLRRVNPPQEIGLHGGLTHLIWTDRLATGEVVEWELAQGAKALHEASIIPLSFSFGREQEAFHNLLPGHGILSYRGRTVARSFRLGPTVFGKAARLLDEVRRGSPRIVWPQETLPGLWNIPSSLFLYSIHPSRTRFTGLRSRIARFNRGIEEAARYRGIFHFCLHPENLTQAPEGFALFDEMLERLISARARGDIDILTMSDVAGRMELGRERSPSAVQLPSVRGGALTY
jgi:peptidoglycan/xylan/chitin deacetylase (PgdA/CDA1 family)